MNLVPSSNVISLAASESQLISPSETVALQSNAGQQQEVKQELEQPQEEEQLQQPIHIAPPGSFAIEAGQEHQWMVADGDTQVILAVQTGNHSFVRRHLRPRFCFALKGQMFSASFVYVQVVMDRSTWCLQYLHPLVMYWKHLRLALSRAW